ncbi:MAG: hypothetical protein U5Q03_09680 [Bacteroidota bacterium]|nr:hypothetical protein [Bacteroidota bacterium]
MKKLIFGISLAAFFLLGVTNVHTVVASQSDVEIVNFDKDPDGKDKKEAKKADKKADAKAKAETKEGSKDCAPKAGDCKVKSDCKDKKTSCCSKSHPDKR